MSISITGFTEQSTRERMLFMRIDTLPALTEPGLTEAAPPWRSRIIELKTACSASLARHRYWRRRADGLSVVRGRPWPVHELLVAVILTLLPFVRVMPASRPRCSIGAFVAVIAAKPFVGLIERQADVVKRTVIDLGLTSERRLRALEFMPSDRRVVRA